MSTVRGGASDARATRGPVAAPGAREVATARLGRSAVTVTRLGVGAAPLGNLYSEVSDAQARATLDVAWSLGLRYVDTAPHYGLGLSERRVGAGLAGRADAVVSSKVGRLLEPWPAESTPPADDLDAGFAVPAHRHRVFDFSREGVRRSVTESLVRLGRDRIDLALVHDPDEHLDQALRTALPALAELREEGLVGAVGVGMNDATALARLVREADLDAVLCAGRYTLLEQSALDDLLPSCAERGVSAIIGGVFNSGLLATSTPPSPQTARYDYEQAPPDVLRRTERLAEVCAGHGVTLPQAAVCFPLGHPAVASVLVGVRSADEVRQAVEAHTTEISAGVWDDLRAEGLLRPDAPAPLPAP